MATITFPNTYLVNGQPVGIDMETNSFPVVGSVTSVFRSTTAYRLTYTASQYHTFTGQAFTYDSNGNPLGGTINSWQYVVGGKTYFQVTGLTMPVQTYLNFFLANDWDGLLHSALAGNDTVTSSSTAGDILYGFDGNDTMNGGAGADVMYGGTGNDIYIVDNPSDGVFEKDQEGFDEVRTSVSLPGGYQFVENFTFTGSGNFTVAGNDWGNVIKGGAGNDVMSGNAGGDQLYGFAGNDQLDGGTAEDLLDGGTGNDVMMGGADNDTYIVDSKGDSIVDTGNDTGDLVKSTISIDLSLFTGVENVTLLGAAALNATGNDSNNILTGNDAANILIGGKGIDWLFGNKGDDYLDGGAEEDLLVGGLGNDTYVVDSLKDSVNEQDKEGTDTTIASITYDLDTVYGLWIENLKLAMGAGAIDGSGNDLNNIVTGNEFANVLKGGIGNDTLLGGVGDDKLEGGAGNDILDGGDGNDVLDGGANNDSLTGGKGNDTYVVDSTGDKVVESLTNAASGGTDTVESSITFSLASLANIDNLTLIDGAGNINGTGNALANILKGNDGNNALDGGAGNDTIFGFAGDDTLTGGLGNDALKGGSGNDTYIVDSLAEIDEEGNADSGDTVVSSFIVAGPIADIENYTYTGSAAWTFVGTTVDNILKGGSGIDTLSGGDGNDQLFGNAGNDVLDGGKGNDLLDGGAGLDKMKGGSGNDIYVVDSLTDVVDEEANTDTNDTVKSAVTWTLGTQLENLILTGTGAINGTGNGEDNEITGNDGANVLDGKGGADKLTGGKGADTYIVDDLGDVVDESVAGAVGGIDLVKSSVKFDLSLHANIENLTLTDVGNIDGKGNDLANIIIGNDGNNRLDGGLGADTLTGGKGNDTYVVDNVGDKLVESLTNALSGGTDTVESSVNFSLASLTNIDNLILTGALGTENLNGTGNALDNKITGNDGNNILDGGAGNDTLSGGKGNDVLTGGLGVDDITGGEGNDTYNLDQTDTVHEGVSGGIDLGQMTATVAGLTFDLNAKYANFENFTLLGALAGNVTGNAVDNVLTGNSAANILDGGDGNDSLIGGAGNDTLSGGNNDDLLDGGLGVDKMKGGAGNDTYVVDSLTDVADEEANSDSNDTVKSSVTYILGAGLENLILTGIAAINGTGNTGANEITGNDGANVLDGGGGADTLAGGKGNDTYILSNGNDTVTEGVNEGIDTAKSSNDIDLTSVQLAAAKIENIVLLTGAVKAVGNSLDNAILGNDGNNILDGGGGNDTLTGGAGNDTYIMSAGTDKIVEAAGAAGGIDTIQSDVTVSLVPFANVENILLTGSGNINGTGNTLANLITGNSGDNSLDGGAGNDTLQGGGGTDILKGGAGNDTYLLDSATITIDEGANKDTGDTVQSGLFDINLGTVGAGKLENAELLGSADLDATGNAAANILTGNSGENRLDGGAGNDTLIGGGGNDTYLIDSAKDVVKEALNQGHDTVLTTANTTTAFDNVEDYTFTGSGDWNFKGNGLDNLIIGGAGDDTIDGGAGNDTVVFTGKSSDYQLTYTEGGAYIVDLNTSDGDNGADWLTNVEHVQFSDTTLDLGTEPILKGAAAGENAGRSVAALGDINKDGFDDFIVGAPGSAAGGAGSGAAYVVFGGASGLPASLDFSTLNGAQGFKLVGKAGDEAGWSVGSAGDINKDGFDDILVGAVSADMHGKDSGGAYVVFGHGGGYAATVNLATLNGTTGFKISGEAAGDFAGGAVHLAGDINGDGYDDLVIGADSSDTHGNNSGSAYVVFGHGGGFAANLDLSSLNGNNGFEVTGVLPIDHAGWSVSSAGDINGDGIDDLLVGAILAGTYGAYSGAGYVLFGHTGGFDPTLNLGSLYGTIGFALKGVMQYDYAGWSVSSAGDINGDGFDDLIVGAPYSDGAGDKSGSAYVVFGHDGSFASSLYLSTLDGTNGFAIQGLQVVDYTGFSVSAAGDVNGDGIDDIIIGAPNAGSKYYGAAYVLYGQYDGFAATIDVNNLNTQQGFWVYGDLPGDGAGVSVSAAGDINGDGYDDLLVGAAFADPHGTSSGAVRVIYGADDGGHPLLGDDDPNTLIGTEEADAIHGRGGDDTLIGLGGDDLLDGGTGADAMTGGAGNDTYLLDDAGDKAVEAASGGNDTIRATGIDIDLAKGAFAGQEIENVTLLGSGNNNVTGNDLANVITGNKGNNWLSGGAGNDTMDGGLGNDTYIVDSVNDKVVETDGINGGIDTVISPFNYTLGGSVENLILTGQLGTENLRGLGNGLANTLIGNDGDNDLDAGLGNDILIGGKGVDTLRGGAQSDVFVFSTGDTGAKAGERDLIIDFQVRTDQLDLSGFDANSVAPGDNLFRFIGLGTFEAAGDLHYRYDPVSGMTTLEGDLDGDQVADFAIWLAGKVLLSSQDFTQDSIIQVAARPDVVTIKNDDDVSINWSGIRPTVSAAGDLNNDGYADFVLGLQAGSNPNGKFSGDAYVVYGTPHGFPDGFSLADLDGTNGFKVWGTAAGESLGYGADTAGDFNGDGVSDLLLSAPWYSGTAGANQTHAYLLYGDPAGTATPVDLSKLDPSDGVKFQGQTNFLGGVGSVASLGDINADGYDDIIIGAPDEGNRGNAYVVFGGSGAIPTDLTKLNGATGFSIVGEIGFGGLGQTVASAGDLNGDGIKDLVVSESSSAVFGQITPHVIFGHAGTFTSTVDPYTLNGTDGFSITGTGNPQGYYWNQSIASAGDMNGDGYGDLIIGGNDSPTYVVFGHGGVFNPTFDVSTLNGSNGFAISAKDDQYLGRSVSGVGDLNGDGYDDIVIGAPGDPAVGSVPGYAYVLYGHASGFDASINLDKITPDEGFVITGPALHYMTGWSVSGAGDIDGDGLDDLLVASPGVSSDGAGHGEVQVIFGKADDSAVIGGSFNDVWNGSFMPEVIATAQGNDTIFSGGGADSIHGGAGNDEIHVTDHSFFHIDGGSGTDVLHLDFAGVIDFGNIDGNAATSDRGRISNVETLDVDNGSANAVTLHLADVLDLDANDTNVGGVATLDNVLKVDGEAGDTLKLFSADSWGAADTSTLAGYAIYTSGNVKVAVDDDIAVSVT